MPGEEEALQGLMGKEEVGVSDNVLIIIIKKGMIKNKIKVGKMKIKEKVKVRKELSKKLEKTADQEAKALTQGGQGVVHPIENDQLLKLEPN